MKDDGLMEKIVSLCKRRGFIFPGSEIYGGLAGTFDFGHLGAELKHNVKHLWWKKFVQSRDDMYGLDSAILMNPEVWEASGHTKEFSDPLIESGKEKRFNIMFQTNIGAEEGSRGVSYLRPETAQGMFVNFKNILDSAHPELPFGMAQIGKAFRNEIAPRDFIFRTREFEQMEVEYFVRESEWEKYFEEWREEMGKWLREVGVSKKFTYEAEVGEKDRAHYSKRTMDFEFDFPFGRKELSGLAYRGDFDLQNHSRASGVNLEYYDDATGERFVPHVIEPSFGLERILLAILVSSYREDELGGGRREYLALPPAIAPLKCAVFPLLKNKPELVEKAREIFKNIKREIPETAWDDNGNVGKRYRRQDEIGTPYCITVDFQTLEDATVTLRDRDTGEQKRFAPEEAVEKIKEAVK